MHPSNHRHSIGVVGARGHVGAELVRLVAGHPGLALAFVSSRELRGQPLAGAFPGLAAHLPAHLSFETLEPEDVAARAADVVVLALPNGKAAPYVQAVDRAPGRAGAPTRIVDLSADYRFDDDWLYGLPELTRERHAGKTRISNPGCYATAMQLAIAPLLDVLDGPVQCFGVSGYSGAGTTPSPRNDPEILRDNFLPYSLIGHVHEREVTRHLGHPVELMPHVAPHFRGITLTATMHVREPLRRAHVIERFRARYAGEPLVRVVDEPPLVRAVAHRHHAEVGGFAVADDGRRVVVVATLDNLLKGAATQALQNINLALGLPEHQGIPLQATPHS